MLKPQDVIVVLKLLGYQEKRPPYSQIALALALSPSEVHGAVKRAQAAGLLHGPALGGRPILPALQEFLIHGVKYAFPPERGGLSRGMPTSYAAPPLNSQIQPGDEPPPVWPDAEGSERGVALEPLYHTVPAAARNDPRLYELLALIDAIRDGRARERNIAVKELKKRLRVKKHVHS